MPSRQQSSPPSRFRWEQPQGEDWAWMEEEEGLRVSGRSLEFPHK